MTTVVFCLILMALAIVALITASATVTRSGKAGYSDIIVFRTVRYICRLHLLFELPVLFWAGGALIFSQKKQIKNRKSKIENLKWLPFSIRGVAPIRSRWRIAAEWGKGCVARASTVKTGYFCALCRRIRACACDIFAAKLSETVYCQQKMRCRHESMATLCSKNAVSGYCMIFTKKNVAMKNNFVIAIIMVFTICIFSKCGCEIMPPSPYSSIKIMEPAVYQLSENGTEVDIKLDIHSYIEDDAYLVLRVEKLCYRCSSNTLHIFGGFKDSLKIDGFHVRSYSTVYHHYSFDTNGSIVDYPMYIKKTYIRKGNNKEEFKIVLPRTISSINEQVGVLIGIVRFNAEIKNNFENFPDNNKWHRPALYIDYNEFYFESFPDSSKTSLVFSHFYFLESLSWTSGNEIPTLYEKCGFPAKKYTFNFPEHPNWGSISIILEP